MKKSKNILLSAVLMAAVMSSMTSCSSEASTETTEEVPVEGWETPNGKDTVINEVHYCHHNGLGWFIVYNNMVNPSYYHPATTSQITSGSYRPSVNSAYHGTTTTTRSSSSSSSTSRGGFGGGSSAHASAGS